MRPLVDSEDKELCQLGIDELAKLRDAAQRPENYYTKMGTELEQNVRYARENLRLLNEFGRHPERNRFLGRGNTDEERAWLRGD